MLYTALAIICQQMERDGICDEGGGENGMNASKGLDIILYGVYRQ